MTTDQNHSEDNAIDQKKPTLNYISMLGFICSLLSVPLFFFCVGQLAGLILSVIGLKDTKKCHDRGTGFAIAGIILSSVIIIVTPLVVIYAIRYGINYFDLDAGTLLDVIFRFLL